MSETFSREASRVVATMAALLKLENQTGLAEVLLSSSPSIVETGSDWGTTFHRLALAVPVAVFAGVHADLHDTEDRLVAAAQATTRDVADHEISEVRLAPTLGSAVPRRTTPTGVEGDRLWGKGLRLFISHIAANKADAAALKVSLRQRGVSAFVAHDDIEPAVEWQAEIELALRTAEAMTAILATGFHESMWTDQEVGYALARGLVIVPMRKGVDPYGFIGRIQGLNWVHASADSVADQLVLILLGRDETAASMREGLVGALEEAHTFASAKAVATLIEKASGYTSDQLRRMEAAVAGNDQVAGAYGVPERIQRFVSSARTEAAR